MLIDAKGIDMGMFDTVKFKCPECGAELELQSKAGECVLHEYHYKAVPPEIAIDLDGRNVLCEHCFTVTTLHYDKVPLVSMRRS